MSKIAGVFVTVICFFVLLVFYNTQDLSTNFDNDKQKDSFNKIKEQANTVKNKSLVVYENNVVRDTENFKINKQDVKNSIFIKEVSKDEIKQNQYQAYRKNQHAINQYKINKYKSHQSKMEFLKQGGVKTMLLKEKNIRENRYKNKYIFQKVQLDKSHQGIVSVNAKNSNIRLEQMKRLQYRQKINQQYKGD